MIRKPKKLAEIEGGEYKLVVVTGRLLPNTYKVMRVCMDELGVRDESQYIQMAIALLNQSKAGSK